MLKITIKDGNAVILCSRIMILLSFDINCHMLKLPVALFAVLSSYAVNAQEIVLTNDRLNICYAKMDNPMRIAVTGVPCGSLVISSKNGIVSAQNGCRFLFTPGTVENASLEVFRKKGNKLVKIGEVPLRIKPAMVAAFAGAFPGGMVEKDALMAVGGIRAKLDEVEIDHNILVTGYKVMIRQKDGLIGFDNSGPRYSPELVTAFSKLNAGDIVLVYDISVQHPDGSTGTAKPLEYRIE